MCGIAGSYGEIELDVAERMLERLAHRGPVGAGDVEVAGNWLGHRRCAIADVVGGERPLVNEAEDLFLVGDGEVYNEAELRRALADVTFQTESNHEVALYLYDRKGTDAFADLQGMFSFIIAGNDGRFVVARDPLGIKPLYWSRKGDRILFASELGAFGEEWLPAAEYFPPGHFWTPESGLVQFAEAVPRDQELVDEFANPSEPGADVPKNILENIRNQLVQAVERQMTDEVRVGAFLSGGLDSSIIAAIAARWFDKHGGKLKTFAVGIENAPDLAAARAVAEHLGTEHYEKTYSPEEAVERVPEVVRSLENFDPSLVRSAVSNYILAEFASPYVDVVLIGEGADEIFAGYDYLEDFDEEDKLQEELIRGLEEGHIGGLQRVDRVTMSHGIQARVPFLAPGMLEVGFAIPAAWKYIDTDIDQPEKRILREAFDGWLPDDVLWRKKAQFGEGSGAVDFLTKKMEETVSEEEFQRMRNEVDPPLRTREEAAYYRIFIERLPGVRPEETISRFVTL